MTDFDDHRRYLHFALPSRVHELAQAFILRQFQLYVVGGAVRDALLGVKPKDYDLATDATPDQIIALLREYDHYNILSIIETGKAFGVIRVVWPEGFDVEIATFRTDVGSGRRPDSVVFATIEQDVMRRDLTINALFYDIRKMEIVDYVGGIADLRAGIVRTVGKPAERFAEDRLRILRAVRFAAQMGCELDRETELAIFSDPSLDGVSPERIRDEFLKCLAKAKSVTHLSAILTRLRLWRQIFPDLYLDLDQVREIRDPTAFLARLLSNTNNVKIAERLNELKYTTQEIKEITFFLDFSCGLVDISYRLHKAYKQSGITPERLRRYASMRVWPLPEFTETLIKFELSVKGQELMAEGFSGRELGNELERREKVRFLEQLNDYRRNNKEVT